MPLRFSRLVFFALASFVFVPLAWASSFTAGQTFHHWYNITNNGPCTVTITSLTKNWSSATGSLTLAEYRPGVASSTAQSGSVTYAVSITLPAGQSIFSTLGVYAVTNFTTNAASTGDTISSSLGFTYDAPCACTFSGNLSVTSAITPVPDSSTSSTTTSSGGVGSTSSTTTSSGGVGSSSSGSGSSSSSGGSSGSSSGGGTPSSPSCDFVLAGGQLCTAPAITAAGAIPTVTPELRGGKYVVPVTLSANSEPRCFDPAQFETIVRNSAIVAGYRNDPTDAWGNLTPLDYDLATRTVYVPVQDKTAYEVRGRVSGAASTLGNTCYFDTRICPIDIIGAQQGQGSCASDAVGDSKYPEARNLMNPNIARLMQPFDDWHTRCDSTYGVIVPSFKKGTYYFNYNPATYGWRLIDECYAPGSDEVVLFDPPAGALASGALNTVILNSSILDPAIYRIQNPDPLNLPAGSDFLLEGQKLTLVVKGSNVRFDDNLVYPTPGHLASFGVIALKNASGLGADIFVRPEPTNLVGAYYAEGSMQTVTAQNEYPTNRSQPVWYWNLRNQLYLEGTLVSRNTIGGAIDPSNYETPYPWSRTVASRCPAPNTGLLYDCPWTEAVKYDISYLREYFHYRNNPAHTDYPNWNPSSAYFTVIGSPIAGGLAASRVPSKASVVIRYDSRVQSNPPPGFERVADMLQGELGL